MTAENTIGHQVQTARTERNYGIDLLRIIAVTYMLLTHAIIPSGILGELQEETLSYKLLSLITTFSMCGSNLFALISGYAGYSGKKQKNDYSKLIELWLIVLFYSITGLLFFIIFFKAPADKNNIIPAVFPIIYNRYWYFTAFVVLFIVQPILDNGIKSLDERQAKVLALLIFVIFSIFTTLNNSTDPFNLADGYSPIWLIGLYIIGAVGKKCNIGKNRSAAAVTGLIFLLALIAWLWKNYGFEFEFLCVKMDRDSLSNFTSPTNVGISFLHVLLFSRFVIPNWLKQTVKFAAPSAFAVYIMNSHPLYYQYIVSDEFTPWIQRRASVLVMRVLFYAIAFLIFAALTDKVRQYIFKKMKIRETIKNVIKKITLSFTKKHQNC